MLSGLSAPDLEDAWAEIGQALAEFDGPEGLLGRAKWPLSPALGDQKRQCQRCRQIT
jgi:hypothetical protein